MAAISFTTILRVSTEHGAYTIYVPEGQDYKAILLIEHDIDTNDTDVFIITRMTEIRRHQA